MAQPVDAVALHQTHRAGVIIGPHRFRAVPLGGHGECLSHTIQRLVPGDWAILPGALGAGAQQWPGQSIWMVDALRIARDLGADYAGGVAVAPRAAHRTDALAVQHFDLEGASRGAVVGAGTVPDIGLHGPGA